MGLTGPVGRSSASRLETLCDALVSCKCFCLPLVSTREDEDWSLEGGGKWSSRERDGRGSSQVFWYFSRFFAGGGWAPKATGPSPLPLSSFPQKGVFAMCQIPRLSCPVRVWNTAGSQTWPR